jgi:hypothetical protein
VLSSKREMIGATKRLACDRLGLSSTSDQTSTPDLIAEAVLHRFVRQELWSRQRLEVTPKQSLWTCNATLGFQFPILPRRSKAFRSPPYITVTLHQYVSHLSRHGVVSREVYGRYVCILRKLWVLSSFAPRPHASTPVLLFH